MGVEAHMPVQPPEGLQTSRDVSQDSVDNMRTHIYLYMYIGLHRLYIYTICVLMYINYIYTVTIFDNFMDDSVPSV